MRGKKATTHFSARSIHVSHHSVTAQTDMDQLLEQLKGWELVVLSPNTLSCQTTASGKGLKDVIGTQISLIVTEISKKRGGYVFFQKLCESTPGHSFHILTIKKKKKSFSAGLGFCFCFYFGCSVLFCWIYMYLSILFFFLGFIYQGKGLAYVTPPLKYLSLTSSVTVSQLINSSMQTYLWAQIILPSYQFSTEIRGGENRHWNESLQECLGSICSFQENNLHVCSVLIHLRNIHLCW